jgi:citrate lyase subunit beta/citryl-CoA lyase
VPDHDRADHDLPGHDLPDHDVALRPRRSVLYMPGANERALEKAAGLPADALILDLEDAVAPDAKVEARDRVCEAAASGRYGQREVVIRANGIGTPWHDDDLRAIAQAGPAGVLVPKVESPAELSAIEAALEAAGAPDRTLVWAMLETPTAMLQAAQVCASSERLAVLVMGTNDLAKELRAEHVPGRSPLLTGLGLCLLAARAGGKVILDGVYNDIGDEEGFEAECRQGRQMGFDGKTLIHPSQIEPCNRIFSPAAEEVERSRRIIEAFEAAEAEGRGVVTVDGRMVENLHVEQARRTLAQAQSIAAWSG